VDTDRIAARLTIDALASRLARRVAMEFATKEALDEYLKEHPAADKSLHWVQHDQEGSARAIQREMQLTHLVKEESEKQWERDTREADQYVSGMREHVSSVVGVLPQISPEILQLLSHKFKQKGKKAEQREARKEIKKQVAAALEGKPLVKNIADRYQLKEKEVQDTIADFVAAGGAKDTQVDLEVALTNKARLAYQTRAIAESRQIGIFPPELLEFVPKNLGFRIDNKQQTNLVEHFGNKTKTMVAKVHEMRLLLLQKNDIMAKVAKGLKSDDEKERMLAVITGMGIHTGIRTGHKGNHAKVRDPETGEASDEETFGATTLLAGHVKFMRDGVAKLEFRGKKATQNVAELDDAELTHHLIDFTRDKGPDQPIFVTKAGHEIDASDVNHYVKEFGITYTDFRKFRGTKEVFEGLKKDMEHMYREIAEKTEANRQKTREKVVKVLYEHLKKIFMAAQTRLNHKSMTETIDSYVNPMVVLNMLSYGKMKDVFDEAIEENGQINFNLDAILQEAKKYMEASKAA